MDELAQLILELKEDLNMEPNKTVRVRIAVAVSPNGAWQSDGGHLRPEFRPLDDASRARMAGSWLFENNGVGHVCFIEADVPVPDAPPTVEAANVAVEAPVTP